MSRFLPIITGTLLLFVLATPVSVAQSSCGEEGDEFSCIVQSSNVDPNYCEQFSKTTTRYYKCIGAARDGIKYAPGQLRGARWEELTLQE